MKQTENKKTNKFDDLKDFFLALRLMLYIFCLGFLATQSAKILKQLDNIASSHNKTLVIYVGSNHLSEAMESPEKSEELALPVLEEELFSITDYYDHHKSIAMEDFFSKVKEDFKINKEMKKRVSFWFDVYAKYDDTKHIIHHAKYPWIVFDVVDISDIQNNFKLHRWTRYHRAKKKIRDRRNEIQNTYKKLSKLRSFRKINSEELRLLKLLRGTPGKFRARLKLASKSIRSQTGQKRFFQGGLSRYGQWIEDIEDTFKKHRLPVELTRIPFVESSFNPEAVSKVGASGIWQIMPSIGKKFLKMNKKIDQRNDPIISAKAAAKLLKENKMILRKWPLAVTAYNTGPGLVRRAMKHTRSKQIHKHIDGFSGGGFGFAAKNFYASFLAALHVEMYQDFFFASPENTESLSSNKF